MQESGGEIGMWDGCYQRVSIIYSAHDICANITISFVSAVL